MAELAFAADRSAGLLLLTSAITPGSLPAPYTLGSENILVTGGSGTAYVSIERGVNGTAAANHAAGTSLVAGWGGSVATPTLAAILAEGGAGGAAIPDVADPTDPQDAATKAYVDDATSGTAISALPAVTVPASTDEFVVNQGGTSKKVTIGQIFQTIDETLSGDVTMTTAHTWYDGPSAAFGVGTWLVIYKALVSGANPASVAVKLWDGSTVHDESEGGPSYNLSIGINGMAIVVLAAPATLKISATSDQNGATMFRDSPLDSATSHTVTRLSAVRIT